MIKKLIALAAGALLSMNASAGYVQYDFSGPISGHFIQHDTDQSIAYFNLRFPIDAGWQIMNWGLTPQTGEGGTGLTDETTYFRNDGPTNFRIYSDFGGDQYTYFDITFSRGTHGNFDYTAQHSGSIYFIGGYQPFAGTLTGTAAKGVVNPVFSSGTLDYYGGYYDGIVRHIVPTYIGPNNIPEPGSLALLAVGALGLVSLRRRRTITN